MNAWNLEDDISRIDSKAEDYLSGIWNAESRAPEKKSGWKTSSNQDASDPFRRSKSPLSGRMSPTPLADLYSQSIYQAEVNSDSWQGSENCNCMDPTDEEDSYSSNMEDVDCMPQDLFSFSQKDTAYKSESPFGMFTRSLIGDATSSVEHSNDEYAPTLIDDAKRDSVHPVKRPLLSLSVGMSICGVGLVFGAQIMHNAAVVNPGKSLIIAGLIGLFVSFALQTVNRFGRRRTA